MQSKDSPTTHTAGQNENLDMANIYGRSSVSQIQPLFLSLQRNADWTCTFSSQVNFEKHWGLSDLGVSLWAIGISDFEIKSLLVAQTRFNFWCLTYGLRKVTLLCKKNENKESLCTLTESQHTVNLSCYHVQKKTTACLHIQQKRSNMSIPLESTSYSENIC